MKLFRYLQLTFKHGSLLFKFIKTVKLIPHTFYYLYRKKIGSYPEPPPDSTPIGYFDKNRLIHTNKQYRHYFSKDLLYQDGNFKKLISCDVQLTLSNNIIVLGKKFHGLFKATRFYTELICLDRLREIRGVPDVKFVDYQNLVIYMEFLPGIVLSSGWRDHRLEINRSNVRIYIDRFKALIHQIHQQNILIHDLRDDNMMIHANSCYIFDFGNSIYHGNLLKPLYKLRRKKELEKLERELQKSINESG